LPPAQARQHEVQDDQVWSVAAQLFQSFHTICSLKDLVAGIAENIGQEAADGWLVFYDENLALFGRCVRLVEGGRGGHFGPGTACTIHAHGSIGKQQLRIYL
jgi:hypothetical protein